MSFPGPGFATMSAAKPTGGTVGTPPALQQANVLTITTVGSSPHGGEIPVNPAAPATEMGWAIGGPAHPGGSAGVGSPKYSIKDEQGAELLLVINDGGNVPGATAMTLTSRDGSQYLRVVSSGPQSLSLLLPTGESLGELIVETKAKKDKDKYKEDKDKHKKDKEEKKHKPEKEKKDKDKDKDAPKRRYALRNPGGVEIMSVSLKSKPKDRKLDMKIKSLQRKGEICMVESVFGPGGSSYQMRFKSGSVTVPNEKLFATGAVVGIIELEQFQQHALSAAPVVH